MIIELKLASNPAAHREIVSQVMTYAAFLHGSDVKSLERGPLHWPLMDAERGSILEAVQAQDEEGAVDAESFEAALQGFLDEGSFRLVLVLDEVPAELERVVAYLDAVTVQSLTIDLITLAVYEVGGAQVALPQRITPDISVTPSPATTARARPSGVVSDGPTAFRASTEGTTGETRTMFDQLIAWAEQLAELPNVRLFTFTGGDTGRCTLMPRIMPDYAGLVTIWNSNQLPYLSVWRSVFERRAPNSIESVEKVIAPSQLGQGTTVHVITTQVLDAIKAAYEETVDPSLLNPEEAAT